MKRQITIVLLLLFVSGCQQYKTQRVMADASAFSTTAITNPSFKPQPGDRFAWHAPIIWSSEELESHGAGMGQLITKAAEKELITRGYLVVADKRNADFIIGAAVIGDSGERAEALKDFFQLFPQVAKTAHGYDKATTVMAVIPSNHSTVKNSAVPDRRSVLWRAGLETYVLGEKLTPEIRELRIQVFTRKLMTSLP